MPTSKPKKLLITGPESSGKSTLASTLSNKLGCNLVPEYARIYLGQLGQRYSEEDLEVILRGQLKAEEYASASRGEWLVCDTGPLVLYIWSTEVFGTASETIVASLDHLRQYYKIFICYPDLEWEKDELRENPEDRERLFDRYKQMLDTLELEYYVVRGADRIGQVVRELIKH